MGRTVKGYRRVKKYLKGLIMKGEERFRKQISGKEDLILATLLSAMSEPPKNSESENLHLWLKSGNGLYLAECVHLLSGSEFEPRRNYHRLTKTSVLVGNLEEELRNQMISIVANHINSVARPRIILRECEQNQKYCKIEENDGMVFYQSQEYEDLRIEWTKQSWPEKGFEVIYYDNPQRDFWSNDNMRVTKSISQKLGYPFELYLLFDLLLLITDFERKKENAWIILQPIEYLEERLCLLKDREKVEEVLKILDKEHLLKIFDFSSLDTIDKSTIGYFLQSLVFSKGKNLNKCPLIPIQIAGEEIYIVWKPFAGFTRSWFGEEFYQKSGHLSNEYGKKFDVFLREILEFSNRLVVNPDENKIHRKEHCNSANEIFWESMNRLHETDRSGFAIDALAWDSNNVYIISCKTRNYLEDARAFMKMGFTSYKEFRKRMLNNVKDMKDVFLWCEILKNSDTFLDKFRLRGKKFIPLLVTPRKDPLQIRKIRAWFEKEIEPLPRVGIIDYASLLRSDIVKGKIEFAYYTDKKSFVDNLIHNIGHAKESQRKMMETWFDDNFPPKNAQLYVRTHFKSRWVTVSMIKDQSYKTDSALLLLRSEKENRIEKILTIRNHGERAKNLHDYLFRRDSMMDELKNIIVSAQSEEAAYENAYAYLSAQKSSVYQNSEGKEDFSIIEWAELVFNYNGRFDLSRKISEFKEHLKRGIST